MLWILAIIVLAIVFGGTLWTLPGYIDGMPRIGPVRSTSPRIVFLDGQVEWGLAGGKVISGAASRDPGNTNLTDVLRVGNIMGKITTVINSLGTVGYYAPAIIGLTNASYTAGAATLTLTVAAATELLRRVGATGSFTLVAPPAASGTVAVQTVTYSAINITNGQVTITPLAANNISGGLVMPTDGSQSSPWTVISEFGSAGTGLKVTDVDDRTNIDTPLEWFPIGGVLITPNLVNYPTDPSLQAWIKGEFNQPSIGATWRFSDTW